MAQRIHLITGGFPRGAHAAHDMDSARLDLLQRIHTLTDVRATTASDYSDLADWLNGADLLITYVAGPIPDEPQNQALNDWLNQGGRWFALHGTSGGKAARVKNGRQMVRTAHHDTLGCFFLNHPPIRRIHVDVQAEHPLTRNLPAHFDVDDELYLIEMLGPATTLLTTDMPADPSPPGFGFYYPKDTSVQADGHTRVLAYEKVIGDGAVAYLALGHRHSPLTNSQPYVHESVVADGKTPLQFDGAWQTSVFGQLLDNALAWGLMRT
jgi:hypothetical protein